MQKLSPNQATTERTGQPKLKKVEEIGALLSQTFTLKARTQSTR